MAYRLELQQATAELIEYVERIKQNVVFSGLAQAVGLVFCIERGQPRRSSGS